MSSLMKDGKEEVCRHHPVIMSWWGTVL